MWVLQAACNVDHRGSKAHWHMFAYEHEVARGSRKNMGEKVRLMFWVGHEVDF